MSSPRSSLSGRQGSWVPNGSAMPHITDLQARVRQELSKITGYTPIDSLLDRAYQSNQDVKSNIEQKAHDQAYVEWLKSEEILKIITRHKEFPYLSPPRKDRYLASRKEHEAQRPMYLELQSMLEDCSRMVGLQTSSQGSMFANGPVSSTQGASPRPLSMPRATEGQSPYYRRPSSQPVEQRPQSHTSYVPSSIAPNTNSSHDQDPFLARFSMLRASATPAWLPNPTEADVLGASQRLDVNDSGRPFSLSQIQSAPEPRELRPSGPRDMPVAAYGPPHPPKQPLKPSLVTSLPQAPKPVYSPARNIPAPSSINPPRSTVRSEGSAAYRTPPNNNPNDRRTLEFNSVHSRSQMPANGTPRHPLPQSHSISVEDLWACFKSNYQILVIDVRPREDFDEGHIHSKCIVCIDPHGVKHGMSFEQLVENFTIYAPDEESAMIKNIGWYDLIVYYDSDSSGDHLHNGSTSTPTKSSSPTLRILHDILTIFNTSAPLQRKPIHLYGGLASWVNLFGMQALQSSNTMNIPQAQRLPKLMTRPVRRISVQDDGSSREIRRRRLEHQKPIKPEYAREWEEEVKREQIAPVDLGHIQDDQVNNDDMNTPETLRSYDDFFRRFPPIEQQSMVSSRPVPPQRPPPTVPMVPSRPVPAVSRPSYSGVSERQPSQGLTSRQPSSTQTPLYTSRFISQSLKLPRTGLMNSGNTCYMNATIQCLLATIPLSRFFLDETYRNFVQINTIGSEGHLPDIYAYLVRALWRNQDQNLRPKSFHKICGQLREDWGNGRQQDAQEFLGFLIDILHEDLNSNHMRKTLKPLTEQEEASRERMPMAKVSRIEWERYIHKEYSYISTLFAGQHASQLRCDICGTTSTQYETFYMIQVGIEHDGPRYTTLQSCLKNYCEIEKLNTEEDMWLCPRCKRKQPSTKQIRITRMPQILVVHFKRFSAHDQGESAKLSTVVDFPLHGLDMSPYTWNTRITPKPGEGIDHAVMPPFIYEAYAVLRHHGNLLTRGHYTAVVRDAANNTWVNFDDSHVRNFNPATCPPHNKLQNEQAYIVFYERSRAK